MKQSTKFLISYLLYSIIMGLFLIPFFTDFKQIIFGGAILGFFAGLLSQIEANTRKR